MVLALPAGDAEPTRAGARRRTSPWLVASACILAALGGCGRLSFDATGDAAAPDGDDSAPSDATTSDAATARTWMVESAGSGNRLWAVTGISASEVYAGTSTGILRSTGPMDWTPVFAAGVAVFGIHAIGTEIIAVGNVDADGPVLVRGRGTTWTRETTGIDRPLNGVWGWPNDFYVVGHDGNILHSTGDGTWTEQPGPTTGILQAVWGATPTDLYAVGYGGVILHSTGDGTWVQEDSTTTVNLISVWGSSDGTVLVAGHDGTVLRRVAGGWTREATGTTSNLANGWTAGPSDDLAVGMSGEIFHRGGDGLWSIESTALAGGMLDGIWSDADTVIVVGASGAVGRGSR